MSVVVQVMRVCVPCSSCSMDQGFAMTQKRPSPWIPASYLSSQAVASQSQGPSPPSTPSQHLQQGLLRPSNPSTPPTHPSTVKVGSSQGKLRLAGDEAHVHAAYVERTGLVEMLQPDVRACPCPMRLHALPSAVYVERTGLVEILQKSVWTSRWFAGFEASMCADGYVMRVGLGVAAGPARQAVGVLVVGGEAFGCGLR